VCTTCHANATCQNKSDGKPTCICNYGFVGNGRTFCQDKDECQIGTEKICGNHTACHNTHGGFYCTCLKGYHPSNDMTTFIPNDGTYCAVFMSLEESFCCRGGGQSISTFGNKVVYQCQPGYTGREAPLPFEKKTKFTACSQKVDCGSPPLILHADILWNGATGLGSTAHYKCLPGFHTVRGKNISVCALNGEWENVTLVCKEINCGCPPVIEHADLVWDNTSRVGSVVYYRCKEEFMKVGGKTFSVCTEGGVWEKGTLICEANKQKIPTLFSFKISSVVWQKPQLIRSDSQILYKIQAYRRSPEQVYRPLPHTYTLEMILYCCLHINPGRNVLFFLDPPPHCGIPSILRFQTVFSRILNSEDISDVSVFNESCLKWRRSTGWRGLERTYLFQIEGRRPYQKEFYHEAMFNFTTKEGSPELCLNLQPGTNYTVNITALPTGLSALITVTTEIAEKKSLSGVFVKCPPTALNWYELFTIKALLFYVSILVKQNWHDPLACRVMRKKKKGGVPGLKENQLTHPKSIFSLSCMSISSTTPILLFITSLYSEPEMVDVQFIATEGQLQPLILRRAEDKNGPISLYQVVVFPLCPQCVFDCSLLSTQGFYNSSTDTGGYVAAEFRAEVIVGKLTFSIGDRQYYGEFYNAPLERGKDYYIILRTISEWNMVRKQSCVIWAKVKGTSHSLQHTIGIGIGSVVVVIFLLFISFLLA
uniref:Sushi domain containing 1 n=1 Tax=Latimeria chalumnae TaxID=7897 RepID=H3ACG5_LATCH